MATKVLWFSTPICGGGLAISILQLKGTEIKDPELVVPNNRSLRLNIGYNDERKKGRKIFERNIFHLEMVAFGNGFIST